MLQYWAQWNIGTVIILTYTMKGIIMEGGGVETSIEYNCSDVKSIASTVQR